MNLPRERDRRAAHDEPIELVGNLAGQVMSAFKNTAGTGLPIDSGAPAVGV
jgi:hypothetical protein